MRLLLIVAIASISIINSVKAADQDPLACLNQETYKAVFKNLQTQGFKVRTTKGANKCDKEAIYAITDQFSIEVQFSKKKVAYASWHARNQKDFMEIKEFFEGKGQRKDAFLMIEQGSTLFTCAASSGGDSPWICIVPRNAKSNKVGFRKLESLKSNWDILEAFVYPSEEFTEYRDRLMSTYQKAEVVEVEENGEEDGAEENAFDTPLTVETMPVFPGCQVKSNRQEQKSCTDRAIVTWIAQNTRYPDIAREQDKSGTVFVKFVVNYNGDITDVEIMRSVHPSLDREAKRVIKSLPQMAPGVQNNERVNVQYVIPVKFVIR